MIRRLPFGVANFIIRCVSRHMFISFAIATGDLKVSMALELIKSLIAENLVGRGVFDVGRVVYGWLDLT